MSRYLYETSRGNCASYLDFFEKILEQRDPNNNAIFIKNNPININAICIEQVIFNDPATIIIWSDGTKTVVKCLDNERFDPEKGLAMAISKKVCGNNGNYYNIFKKYIPKNDEQKKGKSDE